MLDQWNTSTESLRTSPAERLMSRTLLPTAKNLLYPKLQDSVNCMFKPKRQIAKLQTQSTLPHSIQNRNRTRCASCSLNEGWEPEKGYLSWEVDQQILFGVDCCKLSIEEFLKLTEKPPTPSMPDEVSESQSAHCSSKVMVPELTPKSASLSPPVFKRTRTRVIKPPSWFSDYDVSFVFFWNSLEND